MISNGMGKDTKILVELVVVIALVGFGLWSFKSSPAPVVDNSETAVEDTTTGSVNATSPAASISYQSALVKYKDARIQLDNTCQASPDRMTFKNNTNIMIDNRAPVTRTVKVGSTFTIKAYGFKIVNISSASLPATWYVDCDTSQNVSTILIQK